MECPNCDNKDPMVSYENISDEELKSFNKTYKLDIKKGTADELYLDFCKYCDFMNVIKNYKNIGRFSNFDQMEGGIVIRPHQAKQINKGSKD